MKDKLLWIASLLFTILAFGAEFAHLLEISSKLRFAANDYKTIQQVYRGWAFFGIAIFIALILTITLTIKLRHQPPVFGYTLSAAVSIILCLAIFFIFIFPVNRITNNWEILPNDWQQLRSQWEYAHAINAGIYFVAIFLLCVGLYKRPMMTRDEWSISNRQ